MQTILQKQVIKPFVWLCIARLCAPLGDFVDAFNCFLLLFLVGQPSPSLVCKSIVDRIIHIIDYVKVSMFNDKFKPGYSCSPAAAAVAGH